MRGARSQDDIAEEEIAEANEEYLRRLREVKPRTDDEIADDEAGRQRLAMARQSRSAHAEAERLRQVSAGGG